MGLSVAISGGIIMMTLMVVFGVLSVMLFQIQVETSAASQAFDNNNGILKTEVGILGVNASSSSSLVNFTIINQGSEKLWNFDEFDILVTYDANILGVRTPVTEQFIYNASAFEESTGQAAVASDFRIQRGELIMLNTELTSFLTAGTEFQACKGDCFIKLVNTLNTGSGQTVGGGTQNADDFTTYITNDDGLRPELPTTTITFERHGNAAGGNDNRLQWEIWEYIGKNETGNQMIVWDTGTCTYVVASAQCDGASIPGFTGTDEKVVVFVTGQANPHTNNGNFPDCMNTSEWVGGSNIPRFTRLATGIACDVSYAVVEFSGNNWSVQRIEHIFTASASLQTEPISDVGDVTQAFFHYQQRNQDTGSSDDPCRVGPEVQLLSSDTLTYRLPQTTSGWDSSMQSVTWIISNSESYPTEKLIVEHLNPLEEPSQTPSTLPEQNWQVAITSLTYDTSETVITGFTTQSSACGSSFPQGSISAILTDSTTVDLYRSNRASAEEYNFQVAQLPRSQECVGGVSWIIEPNEWTFNCIMYDNFEPGILNPTEVGEVLLKLDHPVFTDGFIEISISSDNGNSVVKTTKAT